MSTATQIQDAIRDLIRPLAITPSTTLTVQATAGASTLTVADTSHFVPGGLVQFADSLGEGLLTVLSISGNVITLDFSGLTSGLVYTHTNGTTVYTNLMTETPIAIGPMLALGDPFVFVTTLGERLIKKLMGPGGKTLHAYDVHIQYHRTLIRPDDQMMDPNRWAYDQQQKARADLDAIENALTASWNLSGTAVTLGEVGTGKPIITKQWRRLTADRDVQMFVAGLDVVVTGAFG